MVLLFFIQFLIEFRFSHISYSVFPKIQSRSTAANDFLSYSYQAFLSFYELFLRVNHWKRWASVKGREIMSRPFAIPPGSELFIFSGDIRGGGRNPILHWSK